jgi:hypothetical protein
MFRFRNQQPPVKIQKCASTPLMGNLDMIAVYQQANL